MNEITEVGVYAASTIVEQGVLGAVLILSLVVNMLLGWLLWKTRDKYTDHLEEHYADQG